MNCREVQDYLNGLRGVDCIDDDPAVGAHLAVCPTCAAAAEKTRRLQQVLQAASIDDPDRLKSPAAHRVEVAARLTQSQAGQHRHRRQFAVGSVMVTALVLIGLFAPLRHEPVDGYRMSVDGVSVELAGDHERLCDMLFALGAVNAGVDVGACDTTCTVVIFDLRTRDEARLVEAAIRNLSPGDVTVDVIPVRYRSAES